jgi:6-pyruvoyltetrahydropterin/6-carboxytetrahydropterin synthase
MFAITVTRTFSAAHAIYLPDGTLEPRHGHDWQVRLTVETSTLDAIETVMDFHELERLVDAVIQPWHNADLNEQAPFSDEQGGLAVNPSAERVAQVIGDEVAKQLPERVWLQSVTVTEAPGCQAMYGPGR